MKIEWIYRFIPVPVFYTSWMVPKAGKSFGFFVFIKPKYKHDKSLLEHELIHCRQFYRTLGVHVILYKLSKKYRYKSELEAYTAQIIMDGHKTLSEAYWIVNILMSGYKLKLSKDDVERDVKNIIRGAKE